jgi:hypothetical protein
MLAAMGKFAEYKIDDLQNSEQYARIVVISDISAFNYFEDILENNTGLAFSLENTSH